MTCLADVAFPTCQREQATGIPKPVQFSQHSSLEQHQHCSPSPLFFQSRVTYGIT